jgi:hypothetical protein
LRPPFKSASCHGYPLSMIEFRIQISPSHRPRGCGVDVAAKIDPEPTSQWIAPYPVHIEIAA